jgi:hypothetical protein
MTEKSTWEEFFDAHAQVYENNVFTKNTIREVDFLLEELSSLLELPPSLFLDLLLFGFFYGSISVIAKPITEIAAPKLRMVDERGPHRMALQGSNLA